MTDILNRLLDLDTLRLGGEGVEFGLTHPLPAWGWATVTIAAIVLSAASYRKLEGKVPGRIVLAAIRGLLLVLLAVLVAGPRLTRPNETEEKDWVLVLADRSSSMMIQDAAAADGGRRRREEQLQEVLASAAPTFEALAKERTVVWLGFDGNAFDLRKPADSASGAPDLGPPDGRRTAIDRALAQAMDRAAARPVSGVILFSDGQSLDEPLGGSSAPAATGESETAGSPTVRLLVAERIPVFAVPLGSERPLSDWLIRRADAAKMAFAADLVPVAVEIERLGPADGADMGGLVQLVDRQTGVVLDERRLEPQDGSPTTKVTLTTRPPAAGEASWEVRLRPDQPDLVTENNTSELHVQIVDRPLRVVCFDGLPRWEYRFLKNLLVRERSIRSSALILASGRRYLQEGDTPLERLPNSPEEWSPIDVVIMGDVRPEVFSREQLEQIRDHIAFRGAGLIWVAGEGATPTAWAGTPLADLVPFAFSGAGASAVSGAAIGALTDGIVVRPTPLAERLGVLRLAGEEGREGTWWPEALSDPRTGWSRLRWAQRIEWLNLKPTAEVLATAHDARQVAGPDTPQAEDGHPLVLTMRYGAGRVLYVATDEIWRWRYGRGDYLPERFWIQMVRLLGRESLSRSGQGAVLEALPDRGEVGQVVQFSLRLKDQSLLDRLPPTVRIGVRRIGEPGGGAAGGGGGAAAQSDSRAVELVLKRDASAQPGSPSAQSARSAAGSTYSTVWTTTESGRYLAESAEPVLAAIAGEKAIAAEFEIWQPEDELRRPATNHALLKGLCERTGGKVLLASDISSLPTLLPNRRVRLLGAPDEETLWDTPLALILVLTMAVTEWIGRRLLRLA